MPFHSDPQVDLIVVGGGAAGYMGAIAAAESGVNSILILEATKNVLHKVSISGGGRCNVTHECWDPKNLVINYPRGQLPLLSPFNRFAAGDAVAWFAEHGIELIAEEDGRMFPVSNTSKSVVDCLRNTAKVLGISSQTKIVVKGIKLVDGKGFLISCLGNQQFFSKRLLLATGGHPSGRKIAFALGHEIILSVPSLFSFTINSELIKACKGIALDNVVLTLNVNKKQYVEKGRVLFTHWGLSGPAIIKLSAFAARSLFDSRYTGDLKINWLGYDFNYVKNKFLEFRYNKAKSTVASARPFNFIPKRLWLIFLMYAGISREIRWADLQAKAEKNLINSLIMSSYKVIGKGPFGEEFVTAGGVRLDQVNLIKMESNLVPGLYFAGEILDVDGITGGFNFQHCWTSGWLAGNAIANSF